MSQDLLTMSVNPPISLDQHHVEGARLFATRERMIDALPKRAHLKFAELGVAYGDFSKLVLSSLNPEQFDAYDLFEFHYTPQLSERLVGKTHQDFYRNRFASEITSGRMRVMVGDSSTELAKAPARFYDFIYIDGDHSYEGVKKDAAVALQKVKDDGLLIFNDYKMGDHFVHFHYGIVHVVNDLCVNSGWRITHFALQNQMFCDVVLERVVLQR